MMIREGISWGMQPDGRALPVSPRYHGERSTRLNGTTEGPWRKSGALRRCWGRSATAVDASSTGHTSSTAWILRYLASCSLRASWPTVPPGAATWFACRLILRLTRPNH